MLTLPETQLQELCATNSFSSSEFYDSEQYQKIKENPRLYDKIGDSYSYFSAFCEDCNFLSKARKLGVDSFDHQDELAKFAKIIATESLKSDFKVSGGRSPFEAAIGSERIGMAAALAGSISLDNLKATHEVVAGKEPCQLSTKEFVEYFVTLKEFLKELAEVGNQSILVLIA